jgi:transposase
MKYVGVDLHKNSISLAVVMIVKSKRSIVRRGRFECKDVRSIRQFFQELGKFQVVVEATASYEWFFLLIEDLADRLVLAHPKKLRVIAESTHKSDKIDAAILAEFLALDMTPEAYRPSPRVRQHRVLVRHRRFVQARITATKCKLRHKASHYNADIASLFSGLGQRHLADIAMCQADRFEVRALQEQLDLFERQLEDVDEELERFGKQAPAAEREARAVLDTMPQMGAVTIDVVLSELGDWRRFDNAKSVVHYAGLDPGSRESAGKARQLKITKEGSRLLRWAMIQAAWRLVGKFQRWERMFDQLKKNTGSKKKAIVGVARRLLCVLFALLRTGQAYRLPG